MQLSATTFRALYACILFGGVFVLSLTNALIMSRLLDYFVGDSLPSIVKSLVSFLEGGLFGYFVFGSLLMHRLFTWYEKIMKSHNELDIIVIDSWLK